jgi:hypothetical protein|nr:MAG TPA: hypothetical protein [Caudoviricetes sp.]
MYNVTFKGSFESDELREKFVNGLMDYATAFDAANGRGDTSFEQDLPVAMSPGAVLAPKNPEPINIMAEVEDTMRYLKPVVERVEVPELVWDHAADTYNDMYPVLDNIVQEAFREGYKAGLEDTLGNVLAHGGYIPETFKQVIPPEDLP